MLDDVYYTRYISLLVSIEIGFGGVSHFCHSVHLLLLLH
jgi:hypothetical protein